MERRQDAAERRPDIADIGVSRREGLIVADVLRWKHDADSPGTNLRAGTRAPGGRRRDAVSPRTPRFTSEDSDKVRPRVRAAGVLRGVTPGVQ